MIGKKNKIILPITVLIMAGLLFIAWVYTGIYGLPWKVRETKVTAEKYLTKKYPDLKYKVGKAHYCSAFDYYWCNIITTGDFPINFQVIVDKKEPIEDTYYEMKVNTEAKNMIAGLIKNSVPPIENISALSDAGPNSTKETYEKYTSYIPEKSYPLKIDIVWKGDKMSLDTFIDKALTVRDIFKNNNISFCVLSIQDSANGYVIELNKDNYNLSKDEVIKTKTAH